MAIYIVYGPPACGKTTNREAIAQFFTGNPKNYVDDWWRNDSPRNNHVHLTTNNYVEEWEAKGYHVHEFAGLPAFLRKRPRAEGGGQ